MLRLGSALVALTVLAACDTGTAPDPIAEWQWHGFLQAEAGWESLSGQAATAWIEGRQTFVAGAELSGDEAGEVRPWHVHHNTCAEGGGIVGSDGDYPRLVIGAQGEAVVITEVAAGLDPAADYHVNVHLSEEEMDVIIACTDLNVVAQP